MTSQRAREAAAEFFRDERTGLAVKFSLGANPAPLLEAFARLEAEALERGARAMQEATVKAVSDEKYFRLRDRDAAKSRVEKRDYDSMAIECIHIELAILAISPAEVVKGPSDAD